MKAVILAAGQGTRLYPLTAEKPKCLVELCGKPLLEHQLAALGTAGITDVAIVSGYKAELLEKYPLTHFYNKAYAITNMVASLMTARALFDGEDDVLVIYGDVVFEQAAIHALLKPTYPVCVAINTQWLSLWKTRMADPLSDAETLKVNAQGFITELGRKAKNLGEIQGQYMGLFSIAASSAKQFVKEFDALTPSSLVEGRPKNQMFMTGFLQRLIEQGWKMRGCPVPGGWLEVDTVEDLRGYEALAKTGKLEKFWSSNR